MAKRFPVNGVWWRIGGDSPKSSNINAHGGDLDFPARYWLYFASIFFLFVGLPAVVDTQSRKQQAKIEQVKKEQCSKHLESDDDCVYCEHQKTTHARHKKQQCKQCKAESLGKGQNKLTSKQAKQKTLYLHPNMFRDCKNY